MKTEALELWFKEKLPKIIEDGSEYPIFLVAIGDKPGALTMNVDEEQEKVLRRVCDDLGLSITFSNGRISKPGVAIGRRPEHDQRCGFIAREESRFEILKESRGRFYGFSDRAVGEFLGFPDTAIEFFVENEHPGKISRKKIISSDIDGKKLLSLTTFIPDPENLEEAVEIGKVRREQLESFDRDRDSSIGDYFFRRRLKTSRHQKIDD